MALSEEETLQEVTDLQNLVLVWINSIPAKRFGRKFNLDFFVPEIRAAYEEVITRYVDSKQSSFSDHDLRLIVASAISSAVGRPIVPGNFDPIKLMHGEFDMRTQSLPYKISTDLYLTLSTVYPGNSHIKDILLSDGFYRTLANEVKGRLDADLWEIPNLANLSRLPIGRRTQAPDVFIMREPDFLRNLNKGNVPEHDYHELSLKLHYLHFWHTTKELIEHMGGHVFVCEEKGKYREFFIRDTIMAMPDGKVYCPDFSAQMLSQVTNSERDIALNSLHKIADIKRFEKLPFAMDASNFVLWDKFKGHEILFLAGYEGQSLRRDIQYFQRDYPGRVMPLPIHPDVLRSVFHGDQVLAPLPDGSVLFRPEYLLDESIGRNVKRVLGKNFVHADRETAENAGINLISVGGNLIMPYCSDDIREELQNRGMRVVTPENLDIPDGSFYYGGGGTHCITLQVPHQILKPEVFKSIIARDIH